MHPLNPHDGQPVQVRGLKFDRGEELAEGLFPPRPIPAPVPELELGNGVLIPKCLYSASVKLPEGPNGVPQPPHQVSLSM